MSVLWCGGEDIDFPDKTATVSTTAGQFRSAYARCAMALVGSNLYLKSPVIPAFSSAWFSLQFSRYVWSGVTPKRCIGLAKSGTNAWIGIGTGSATDKIGIRKYDGTTDSLLAEESGASIADGLNKIDIQIINYGPSGTINVYREGALAVSYTGDIAVLNQTTLDQIYVLGFTSSGAGRVSEFILADEDTRLMSLKTLAPSAAGDASEWTNGYANIDEVTLSDADTIYTSAVDQSFQCSLTGMPTGDFICKGVKMVARATDGTGGIGMQLGVKTNSIVDLGSPVTLGGVWQPVETLYNNNPVTANRFTPAEIEDLQLAVKSVAV